jgi:hypothetical protein
MEWVRLSRGASRIPLVFAAWCVSASLFAQPTPSTHFQLDVGLGNESQISPLFQVSPESNIIYQEGVDRLSGSHMRTALQGTAEWAWSDGVMASLAADATFKRSPGTPGFDFGSVSLQPSVNLPMQGATVGLGLSLQGLDVAGQHFRDVAGIQANWTRSDGEHLWGVVVDASTYKHNSDLADMDAVASSVVVLRQIRNPLPGIDGLDFSGIVGREESLRRLGELSNRSAMLTFLIRWSGFGADWSLGRGWRRAVFDDTVFPGEPPREDRTAMLDLAVQWPLSTDQSLRLEFNETQNASSTRLYDNLYRQFSMTLRSSF